MESTRRFEVVDQLRDTRLVAMLLSIAQPRLRLDIESQNLGVTVFDNVSPDEDARRLFIAKTACSLHAGSMATSS